MNKTFISKVKFAKMQIIFRFRVVSFFVAELQQGDTREIQLFTLFRGRIIDGVHSRSEQ